MKDYTELIESIGGVKAVERMSDIRYFIDIEPLKDDKEATIDLTLAKYDTKDPKNITNLWYKWGFTDKIFKSVVWISACITVQGTKKYGIDPQSKHLKIIFENLREVSEENIKEMVEMSIDKYKNQEIESNTNN